jgi:hypothetical protein
MASADVNAVEGDNRELRLLDGLSEVHRLVMIANRPRNRLGRVPPHLSREVREALEAINRACEVAAHTLADYYQGRGA